MYVCMYVCIYIYIYICMYIYIYIYKEHTHDHVQIYDDAEQNKGRKVFKIFGQNMSIENFISV